MGFPGDVLMFDLPDGKGRSPAAAGSQVAMMPAFDATGLRRKPSVVAAIWPPSAKKPPAGPGDGISPCGAGGRSGLMDGPRGRPSRRPGVPRVAAPGEMPRSIRSQILIPLVAVQGVAVATLAATSAALAARRSEAQIVGRLDAVIDTLGRSSFPYTGGVLARMRGLSGAHFAAARDDGAVAESTLPIPDVPPPAAWPAGRRSAQIGSAGSFTTLELAGARYLAARLDGPGRPALLVLYPEASWRQARWDAAAPAAIVGAITLALMAAAASWVAHRIGARMRPLQDRVARIADGEFDGPRAEPGPPDDEVRSLGASIDRMAAQLRAMQQEVRRSERDRLLAQLAAGLAHQLRNSLTGARLSIQLHARRSPPRDGDETLAVALRQLALTEEQVKGILSLGRAEVAPRADCDVGHLLDDVAVLVGPSCRHAGVTLRREGAAGLPPVRADAAGLRASVLNLVLNAAEAAGPGGVVTLAAAPGDGGVAIEVEDDGPGPRPDVAARLMEPFVTTKPEGVGIGLALARRVAVDHGGTLGWGRAEGRTRFRLTIPAGVGPEESP